ncbi:MAG: hypothetical protein BWY66_02229 [bacterium ADurb.Bin374]|nr:MAG: hypothetical protein BWY66_02229 [bacterium ADurb.Bin374]
MAGLASAGLDIDQHREKNRERGHRDEKGPDEKLHRGGRKNHGHYKNRDQKMHSRVIQPDPDARERECRQERGGQKQGVEPADHAQQRHSDFAQPLLGDPGVAMPGASERIGPDQASLLNNDVSVHRMGIGAAIIEKGCAEKDVQQKPEYQESEAAGPVGKSLSEDRRQPRTGGIHTSDDNTDRRESATSIWWMIRRKKRFSFQLFMIENERTDAKRSRFNRKT